MTTEDERAFFAQVRTPQASRNGATSATGAAINPEAYAGALIDWTIFWDRDRHAEDWLVEPVLPRGRSVATYSPAKVGKSLHALDVAARLATGRRVFDRPAGEPVHVVYVDLEMTEDDLYERLDDMGYGPDVDLSHLHYYLLPSLPPLDTPEGGAVLLAIARLHKAVLVIIDTTSRVLGGAENDADTLRAFHQFTGLPLKSGGVTVWRLDHAGKDLSRGQRGTSAKADDVDLVWQLTPREEGGLRLKATHRRQSWIPEVVDLVRLDEPLRHELAAESWPAGTHDLADLLDRLDIPLDWGGKRVRKALREAGHKATNVMLTAAIRYRKGVREDSGHPAKTGVRDDQRTPAQTRFADTLPDTSGHPAQGSSEGVSLSRGTPSPTPAPEPCEEPGCPEPQAFRRDDGKFVCRGHNEPRLCLDPDCGALTTGADWCEVHAKTEASP